MKVIRNGFNISCKHLLTKCRGLINFMCRGDQLITEGADFLHWCRPGNRSSSVGHPAPDKVFGPLKNQIPVIIKGDHMAGIIHPEKLLLLRAEGF